MHKSKKTKALSIVLSIFLILGILSSCDDPSPADTVQSSPESALLTATAEPTVEPTAEPTVEPTAEPTAEPTVQPTAEPTVQPTAKPTAQPVKQEVKKEPVNPPAPAPDAGNSSGSYIGNINTKKVHHSYCSTLPNEENRVYFNNLDNALNQGYVKCKRCFR